MTIFEEFSDLPFVNDNEGSYDGPEADFVLRFMCPHCGEDLTGLGKARAVIVGACDMMFTGDGFTPENSPGEWLGDEGFAEAFASCVKCGGRFRLTDEIPSGLSALL